MVKYVVGFDVYGNPREHIIRLTEQRQDDILAVLKRWIREGKKSAKVIPFDEFRQ